MTYIRHESLFSLQDLFAMEQKYRFEAIFTAIDIEPILRVVSKKSRLGAPVEVHYSAMIYSLIARILERIPTIKDLIRRLREDILFRLDCGFMLSDSIPSEASYSRLIQKISQSNVLEQMQQQVISHALQEGFICDDTIAIDATHVVARDQAPKKQVKEKPVPKKRGRKSKEEHAIWLEQKKAEEASKTIYQREIADQLTASYEQLSQQMPLDPQWGIKKNSEQNNVFWYGYKAHLAVGTSSQYILGAMLSSGNLNDGKAAIPLLKGLKFHYPNLKYRYATMDAGYDHEPIYEQVREAEAHAIIAYNRRREPEYIGFDEHFAPTCVREQSYRYDSYDAKYETLKYVRPKACEDCPLKNDSLCQKVYKIKITSDLRKYTAPARGTVSWDDLAKRRTAVERVNAYLKGYFQLNHIRHRSGQKAKAHLNLVSLVYNGTKLAVDRINKRLKQQAA